MNTDLHRSFITLIFKMLAVLFASSCAVFVAIWLRSCSSADMYGLRLSSTTAIELQTDAGYLIIQSAAAPFIPTHLLTHDAMEAHPLPGIARWSFAGFSIRTFQWQFLKSSPSTLFIMPVWFFCVVSCALALCFAAMGRRRRQPVFQVVQNVE